MLPTLLDLGNVFKYDYMKISSIIQSFFTKSVYYPMCFKVYLMRTTFFVFQKRFSLYRPYKENSPYAVSFYILISQLFCLNFCHFGFKFQKSTSKRNPLPLRISFYLRRFQLIHHEHDLF